MLLWTLGCREKEGAYTLCNSMDGTGEHYVKWNKPDSEGQIPYDFWHSLKYLFKYLRPSWDFIGIIHSENILMFLLHVIKNAKQFKYKEVSQSSFLLITILMPFKDISRIKLSQRLSFREKKTHRKKSLLLVLLYWNP